MERDIDRNGLFYGVHETWKQALKALPLDRQAELDGFIRHIREMEFFKQDGALDKEWSLFKGMTWGEAFDKAFGTLGKMSGTPSEDRAANDAGDAAWDAALDADIGAVPNESLMERRERASIMAETIMNDSSMEAPWRRLPRYSATYAAFMAVSQEAELAATSSQELDAEGRKDIPFYVAMAASLYARYLTVSDLDFPDKKRHQMVAIEMWNVIEQGYAWFCDIDGRLQVLCKDENAPKLRRMPGSGDAGSGIPALGDGFLPN